MIVLATAPDHLCKDSKRRNILMKSHKEPARLSLERKRVSACPSEVRRGRRKPKFSHSGLPTFLISPSLLEKRSEQYAGELREGEKVSKSYRGTLRNVKVTDGYSSFKWLHYSIVFTQSAKLRRNA